MSYEVRLLPPALKGLELLPKKIQAAVYAKLAELGTDPKPPDSKLLKGAKDFFAYAPAITGLSTSSTTNNF